MEFTITIISALLGSCISILAFVFNAKKLRERIELEKRLTCNLAKAFDRRNINAEIESSLNEITIKGEIEEADIEAFKATIKQCMDEALADLVPSEKKVVIKTIDQPSLRGQLHYLQRLVKNSLNQVNHQHT